MDSSSSPYKLKNSIRKMHFLPVTLLVLVQFLPSPSLAQSQPLMNQLAALFRARPPWPTTFPSDPLNNPGSNLINTDSVDGGMSNSINYSDNDFTHLNDLLTAQSLQQDGGGSNSGSGSDAFLGPDSFYISSSTPPIIVKDSTGANPKGILIAHPVLGPNQLSMNPDTKYNFQQHRPRGSTRVKMLNSGNGGGLYASMGGPHQPNNQQQMIVPSLQTLISEGLKSHLGQRQNHKMHKFNGNHKYPQIFPLSGSPPPGSRVIAIPVPSKIPFSPNSNGMQFSNQNQNFQNQNQNDQNQNQMQQQQQQQASQFGPLSSFFNQNQNNKNQLNFHPNTNNGMQHQPQQSLLQSFHQNQQLINQNLQNLQQNFPQSPQNVQQAQQSHHQPNYVHQNQQQQTFQYQPYMTTTQPPQFTPSSPAAAAFSPSQVDLSSSSTSITTQHPTSPATNTTTTTSPSTTTTSTITTGTTTRSTTTTSPSTTTSATTTSASNTNPTTILTTTTTTPKPQQTYSASYDTKNNNAYQYNQQTQPYFTSGSGGVTSYNTYPTTTTQAPWKHYSKSNNIQDVIVKSHSHQHQHQNHPQLITSPSTLVGSFGYPDPPSPPNFQSLNTRYELPSQNTDAFSVGSKFPTPSYYPTKSPQQLYNSYTDLKKKKKKKDSRGYFEPSVSSVSPFASSTGRISNSIAVSSNFPDVSSSGNSNNAKWKYHLVDETNKPKAQAFTATSASVATSSYGNGETFKPSPQLHSFEDSTSGLREYITVNPPSRQAIERDGKSLQIPNPISDDLPTMESGFRPFNHFAFVNGVPGASISTTTETSVLNLIRNEFIKEMKSGQINQWSEPDPTGPTFTNRIRQDRQFNGGTTYAYNNYNSINNKAVPLSTSSSQQQGSGGFYNTNAKNQYGNYNSIVPQPPTTFSSPTTSYSDSNTIRYTTSTSSPLSDQWVGRLTSSSSSGGNIGIGHIGHTGHRATTSSSELYEDWLSPVERRNRGESTITTTTTTTSTTKKPIYFLGKTKNPLECEKFHRFGFCPVTYHYPLEQVESIGSRCSTLLSHLVAPLPKTDVRYDVIVPKNGNNFSLKGRSAAPSGWSWKNFSGKPVCDTKEVKIIPGWAKNEQGEWLVILQSEKWQQEAQISLCTSQGTHYCSPSDGPKCEEEARQSKTKCVQRFTAQRLVVLDPEDQDRCPVVRSVFLPSACVCLNDEQHNSLMDKKGKHHSSNHHHHSTTKHSSNSNSNNHHHNSHTSSNNSSSPTKKSQKKAGRSLSTSFFGFGSNSNDDDVELEIAADSSTSLESKVVHTTTKSPRDDEEEDNSTSIPVISVRNPSNTTIMVTTSEKVSENESSGSTESSAESNKASTKNASMPLFSESAKRSTSTSTSTSSFPTLSSILGAAFMSMSSTETSRESSSSKSIENET